MVRNKNNGGKMEWKEDDCAPKPSQKDLTPPLPQWHGCPSLHNLHP